MAARRFFAFLTTLSFLAIIFCDIAPETLGMVVPETVIFVVRIVGIVSLVLSLGFKGIVRMIISLLIMYAIYVLLTVCLIYAGLSYGTADLVGTIASIAFMLIVSFKD